MVYWMNHPNQTRDEKSKVGVLVSGMILWKHRRRQDPHSAALPQVIVVNMFEVGLALYRAHELGSQFAVVVWISFKLSPAKMEPPSHTNGGQ